MKFSAICNGRNDQKKGVKFNKSELGYWYTLYTDKSNPRLGRELFYLSSRVL
ncbi:hypothetical protein EMST110833_10390 [Empedobacter stercoris]